MAKTENCNQYLERNKEGVELPFGLSGQGRLLWEGNLKDEKKRVRRRADEEYTGTQSTETSPGRCFPNSPSSLMTTMSRVS